MSEGVREWLNGSTCVIGRMDALWSEGTIDAVSVWREREAGGEGLVHGESVQMRCGWFSILRWVWRMYWCERALCVLVRGGDSGGSGGEG